MERRHVQPVSVAAHGENGSYIRCGSSGTQHSRQQVSGGDEASACAHDCGPVIPIPAPCSCDHTRGGVARLLRISARPTRTRAPTLGKLGDKRRRRGRLREVVGYSARAGRRYGSSAVAGQGLFLPPGRRGARCTAKGGFGPRVLTRAAQGVTDSHAETQSHDAGASSPRRSVSPGEIPAAAHVPAGNSRQALARRTMPVTRHGRMPG